MTDLPIREQQKRDLLARRLARPRPRPTTVRSPPCLHEGRELTGSERERAGLKHSQRWLLCEHPEQPLGAVTCPCRGCGPRCPGYAVESEVEPDPGCARRHLVYHLLPVAGNGAWQRGVDQLRGRWPLFTGTKTVAIMTGQCSHPLDTSAAVREQLPPDCSVIELPNDPNLREVVSWIPLWQRVLAAAAPQDAILYAHTKGVTRKVDPGNSCQWWASLLYSLMLDHWPSIARQLGRHPITGAFKKVGHGFAGSRSAWHYSGSFFWARASDFQRRPWRKIDRKWWGNESWPGTAYTAPEAGCLFHEGRVPSLNLYDPRYWPLVRMEFERWLKRNPPSWPWLAAEPTRSAGG